MEQRSNRTKSSQIKDLDPKPCEARIGISLLLHCGEHLVQQNFLRKKLSKFDKISIAETGGVFKKGY